MFFGVYCYYLLVYFGDNLNVYIVVIKKEFNFCGGLKLMYEQVIVLMVLDVEMFDNEFFFGLKYDVLLIGGGIGIILIYFMV